MAENEKEIERLDKEFNKLMLKLKQSMHIYGYREKYLLAEWLKKLKQSKSSLDECKLRNRFIKYFVDSQEAGVNVFCSDPFSVIPKDFTGTLTGLKKLLPKDPNEALNATEDEKRFYITNLFDSLVDKGAFLAQQPVPKNGSFFILILKPDEESPHCS